MSHAAADRWSPAQAAASITAMWVEWAPCPRCGHGWLERMADRWTATPAEREALAAAFTALAIDLYRGGGATAHADALARRGHRCEDWGP